MSNTEVIANIKLASRLIKNQCPNWAHLPLETVASCGTDNSIFRLGSKYVVRLRRTNKSIVTVHKEYEWVPKIAKFLRTPISEPLFMGNPDESYPWPWLVHKWNQGGNPVFEKENEYEHLAKDLAYFLNDLHEIKLDNGPASRLGMSLQERDLETRAALSKLSREIDILRITEIWDHLSNVPPYNGEAVWIHGDFLPINILINNNRLSAVIDFTDLGMGDRACDLIIAWSLFNFRSRLIFKENLKNMNEHIWQRGRGWALSVALVILRYYKDKNPTIASLAKQMIKNTTQ